MMRGLLLARKRKALTKVKSILHQAVVEWKWPTESDDANSDVTENQQALIGGGLETDSDIELSDGE